VSSITRLHKILRIVVAYRLDDFVPAGRGKVVLRLLLAPYFLLSLFSRRPKGDKEQRLKEAFEALGPIYIKFGQLLSTRRDFLDDALADELQALQDKVPPFPMPGSRADRGCFDRSGLWRNTA